ncbi:hypothetical protein L7F22_030516 [Adiantum nelumboides]|nr:hypothetical protein [Adiantum nelumboides]
MADKGKDKLPVEESSSSTRRHCRETAATDTQFMASARTAARTTRDPRPSMTAEEQEENGLFTAQLMSMMGTFEQLVKNPQMQKLLKTKDYRMGSQAETSQQATSRQRQVTEPVERVPTVVTGPVQHVTQAQDPARNGHRSNEQFTHPIIPMHTSFPGYFGGFGLHSKEDDGCVLSNRRSILLEKKTPCLFHKQGFARIAAPPHLQRQVGLKIYRGSSGTIIDPYHVRARSPFLERWFTRKGWQEIKESIMRELRSGYTLAKLRQKTGKTRKSFYNDVEKLYMEINKAIAEGNRNALKDLVTENMLSILKNEIKKREGIWDRLDWRLGDSITVSTLQARMGATDPKDLDKAFVQVTVLIKSTQFFGAFDREGKLVAGEPSKQVDKNFG